MTILGLILARGGSKRIPNKNLIELGGRPLIAWTITAALSSEMLGHHVVVSSDSDRIQAAAAEYGAVPITRPPEMATDEASPYPAMIHALQRFAVADWLCLLQATSPFRVGEDIDACINMAHDLDAPVVSVSDGETRPNGAVYVGQVEWLESELERGIEMPFDQPDIERYYMPEQRGIDIDTFADLRKAERLLSEWAA